MVAPITGFLIGGDCELALRDGHRICAANARLGLPATTFGLIPGAPGTQRLTRLVYTGAVVSAARAHEIGLVDEVVPAAAVLPAAVASAGRFTA